MRSQLEAELARILRDYGPALARLAASYEGHPARREELLQEIALALWRALPTFRGESSERTFIYRVAPNRAATHVWRRPPAHDDIDGLPETRVPVDPRPNPDEVAERGSARARLERAIRSLPLAHRQVILLLLEDFSNLEIAELLGISANNVAVRLNRARAALRAALGEEP